MKSERDTCGGIFDVDGKRKDIEELDAKMAGEGFWDDQKTAQEVIVNMCFNMGAPRLSGFKKFIAGVNAGDWKTAAVEMMDSRWARQVGDRAVRLKNRILTLA